MIRKFDHSNALYERALKTIPLASQTFSKSAMSFVQGATPLFMERGEGAYVWDVDGNRYIDYVMGLLPNVLGYCDPDVDMAIKTQLARGITFSMATELEINLAELLTELIPCAEMVRFGKNGSDVTSAAIRLARAHTGRDKIAICGYHGWHDWYIGTTSRDLGVPQAVKGLSTTFAFNDANAIEEILKNAPNDYAAVILEPTGLVEPKPGFLEALRELTNKYGVVLIFDEIITGFRLSLGGAQEVYGVTPDLACFGKSMGNGMPISAIVGRRDIMKLMDDIFFSGTFGGESLSLAASLATINKIRETNTPDRIAALGGKLKRATAEVFQSNGLNQHFEARGSDWWPYIAIISPPNFQTLATSLLRQETVAHGLFLAASFNISLAHCTPQIEAESIKAIKEIGKTLAGYFASDQPQQHLRGHPVISTFKVRKG